MLQRPQRWLIYLSLILLVVSCGEPVPVDCTPDEEQCTTETEGGFETGPVAGIAAGGAAVVAIAAGGLGGGDGGGSSSTSQSGASNTNQNTPTQTGTLLDSAVGGVSYSTSSNLSGLTNTDGQFQYRSGDQVTFSVGDTVLGKVNGGELITPVELAGTNNTADRRVINISRLLQSLDQDGNPTNGISVSPATRSMLAQQAFKFDIPVTEFQLKVNPFIENILKRPIIPADEAINHLHGSLNSEGRPGSIGSQDDIRQLVPGFVAVTPANVPSNQPSNTTQFNCNFAGGTVPDGGSVIAYQSPNVAAGQLCSSQTRFCNNGLLSGSYAYMSCQVQEATDCQFNGNSIANGTSVTTYQSSTVPFGQSCQSEQRFCTNGVLGGTYPFQTCSEAGPTSCAFNGSDVPHGDVITAFLADSISSGSSCSSQVRSCFNGVLSGTYANTSCAVNQAQSCSFNGQIINDGQSVTAYLSNSVPFGSNCVSETRICEDGILNGSYVNSTCSVSFNSSWTQQLGTSGYEGGNGIATYSNGSIYVTGSTDGNLGSEINAGETDLFLIKYNNNGVMQWIQLHGTFEYETSNGVATDSNGNVYVAGNTQQLDRELSLLLVIKYDSKGLKKWTTQLETTNSYYGRGIATDSEGNVYVTGYTSGDLDGNVISGIGRGGLFVVKYDSSGTKQWVQQEGTSANAGGYGITTDSEGNVYATGYTSGVINFKTDPGQGGNLLVVKYNSSGIKQWTQELGTPNSDVGRDITTDSSGNIYVTGYTYGGLDGNTNIGENDLFVVKYNSSGVKQWTRQLGTSSHEIGNGISADSVGNIYVTGSTDGNLDGNISAGGSLNGDIYVVKYNSDGIKQWTQQFGSPPSEYSYGIDIDSNSNIYVTGHTWGGLDGNTNAGATDIFVIKYNSSGVKQ